MALLSDSLLLLKNGAIEKGSGSRVVAFHELRVSHGGRDANENATLTIEELEKSQTFSPLKFSLKRVDMTNNIFPRQHFVHKEIDMKKRDDKTLVLNWKQFFVFHPKRENRRIYEHSKKTHQCHSCCCYLSHRPLFGALGTKFFFLSSVASTSKQT